VTFRYPSHYIRDLAEELGFFYLSGSGTGTGWFIPTAVSSATEQTRLPDKITQELSGAKSSRCEAYWVSLHMSHSFTYYLLKIYATKVSFHLYLLQVMLLHSYSHV
jgi:hypothetical protein